MASNNVSLTGMEASTFHISEQHQQQGHEHRARSTNTAGSSFTQRRMDAMARLMHSQGNGIATRKNPVVTAVAFGERDGQKVLLIAHNRTSEQVENADAQRLRNLAGFLKREKSPEQFREDIRQNENHGMDTYNNHPGMKYASAEDRLMADANKLWKTYEGNDNDREGGAALHANLRAVIDHVGETGPLPLQDATIPIQLENKNDKRSVHAEAALVHRQSEGAIGVSKLSCGDCDDYAATKSRQTDLRGTHGMYFPKWVNPDHTNESTGGGHFQPAAKQYASDSDSD
ncbi:hypothetical protein [Burkholderia ubonensis]|nr:hypothetical protein [Burkholderia ubonensis]